MFNTTFGGKFGNRGVSPVIGEILMVILAVILAAVISSFVLGIGGDMDETPQASLQFDEVNDNITHNGGDTLEDEDYHLVLANGTVITHDGALPPGETWNVGDGSIAQTARIIHNSTGNVIAQGDL